MQSLVCTHDYIIWQRSLTRLQATHIDQASLALRQVKTFVVAFDACHLCTGNYDKSEIVSATAIQQQLYA